MEDEKFPTLLRQTGNSVVHGDADGLTVRKTVAESENYDQIHGVLWHTLAEIVALRCLAGVTNVLQMLEFKLDVKTGTCSFVLPRYETDLSKAKPESWEIRRARYFDVLLALAECEKRGVWPMDIKPNNILVRGTETVLCDFGAAVFRPQGLQPLHFVPSQHQHQFYAAPESCYRMDDFQTNFSMHLWGLGVGLLESCIARRDRMVHPASSRATNVDPSTFNPNVPDPRQLADLLDMILVKDPRERCSVADAIAHPWFAPVRAAKQNVQAPPNWLSQLIGEDERKQAWTIDGENRASWRAEILDEMLALARRNSSLIWLRYNPGFASWMLFVELLDRYMFLRVVQGHTSWVDVHRIALATLDLAFKLLTGARISRQCDAFKGINGPKFATLQATIVETLDGEMWLPDAIWRHEDPESRAFAFLHKREIEIYLSQESETGIMSTFASELTETLVRGLKAETWRG